MHLPASPTTLLSNRNALKGFTSMITVFTILQRYGSEDDTGGPGELSRTNARRRGSCAAGFRGIMDPNSDAESLPPGPLSHIHPSTRSRSLSADIQRQPDAFPGKVPRTFDSAYAPRKCEMLHGRPSVPPIQDAAPSCSYLYIQQSEPRRPIAASHTDGGRGTASTPSARRVRALMP